MIVGVRDKEDNQVPRASVRMAFDETVSTTTQPDEYSTPSMVHA